MSANGYHVSLTVFPENAEEMTRSTEVLARAIAGLALEGLRASMSASELDDSEDDS
jgi:hypothetical protein